MLKGIYHPNAYLATVRNIKRGLKARTLILNGLEKRPADAKTIAGEVSMHYEVVMHHLKLLKAEGIVDRSGKRPYSWTVTGLGQKRLATID